ncbi:unnamed protein product [Amoebophrya sp. A120]|nr:unnamed protein product [Amoebophrya sp. A120]|eukprot:GSA120T00017161001.1
MTHNQHIFSDLVSSPPPRAGYKCEPFVNYVPKSNIITTTTAITIFHNVLLARPTTAKIRHRQEGSISTPGVPRRSHEETAWSATGSSIVGGSSRRRRPSRQFRRRRKISKFTNFSLRIN